MKFVAPNMTMLVGAAIAAQLIGAAGGLLSLSKLPASTVQMLGISRKILSGLSSRATTRHVGFVFDAELVGTAPANLRKKTAHEIASKVTLAARVDSFCEDPSGSSGLKFLEDIKRKLEKWQEPPPAKQEKPLPAPDMGGNKKRRGGKRFVSPYL